jgi:hypothetical protein
MTNIYYAQDTDLGSYLSKRKYVRTTSTSSSSQLSTEQSYHGDIIKQ